jgi:hypothetical protein
MPPQSQHLIGWRAVVSSAVMPAMAAVTASSACAACPRAASHAGWDGYVGRVPDLWQMRPAAVKGPQASVGMGQRPDAGPNAGYLFSFFFIRLNISRNSYNIPKFIENKIKLRKIQTKIL